MWAEPTLFSVLLGGCALPRKQAETATTSGGSQAVKEADTSGDIACRVQEFPIRAASTTVPNGQRKGSCPGQAKEVTGCTCCHQISVHKRLDRASAMVQGL